MDQFGNLKINDGDSLLKSPQGEQEHSISWKINNQLRRSRDFWQRHVFDSDGPIQPAQVDWDLIILWLEKEQELISMEIDLQLFKLKMSWGKLDYPSGELKRPEHKEEITQFLQMQEARNTSTQGLQVDDKQGDNDSSKPYRLHINLVRIHQEFQKSILNAIDCQILSLEGWQEILGQDYDCEDNWTEEAKKHREAISRVSIQLQEARDKYIQGLEDNLVQYVGIKK
ncbi:hypothetical protein N7540_005311 [Penicillium herquei]|nr:hypothetical protein N7540_005311 [Penicillium herquei]